MGSDTASDTQGPVAALGQGRRVTVVGAGFSGLASAFYLNRAGFEVEVIEANDRPGGLINSIEMPFGLVETAANGLLNSAEVEDLFTTIGAKLIGTKTEAKKRFVFREGRPRRLPLGFFAALRMFAFVFRAIITPKKVAPRPGEPVTEWGRRVMGAEASNYTVETFLQGIYAGDSSRMSASLIFGRMFNRGGKSAATSGPVASDARKVPKRRPRIRGTVSAEKGMGEVTTKLHAYLAKQGVNFRFGERVALTARPGAPHVIATSALHAAPIIEGLDGERARLISDIELLPLITTTVSYREPIPTHGFGCLFPPSEGRRFLGVLMNTFIFEGRAKAGFSETWIMGGARGEERVPGFLEKSDDEILRLIDEERAACFGARSERIGYRVTRWPKALPHYTLELERALPEIEAIGKNVFFAGNWLGQIGLAKILERAACLPKEISARGEWTS